MRGAFVLATVDPKAGATICPSVQYAHLQQAGARELSSDGCPFSVLRRQWEGTNNDDSDADLVATSLNVCDAVTRAPSSMSQSKT